MIRRLEGFGLWKEYQPHIYAGYRYRDNFVPIWRAGTFETMEKAIAANLYQGMTEVQFDPNDLQACQHVFDFTTELCKFCSVPKAEWLGGCCRGGVGPNTFYSRGKWHDGDCKSLSPWSPPKIKCECGAHKTSNPNCHSAWCPEFKKA